MHVGYHLLGNWSMVWRWSFWENSVSKAAMFTLNLKFILFNWSIIQVIILHSILVNYVSVHICKDTNKLARVTLQSEVESLIFRRERQGKLPRLEEDKSASSLHKAIRSFASSCHHACVHHFVQLCTVITSNNPLEVVWSYYNLIIIRDCNYR